MLRSRKIIMVAILIVFVISACGAEPGEPTLSVELIQTIAVMTYQAQLTQTALVLPTPTPWPTSTPVPVVTFASPEGATPNSNSPVVNTKPANCYGLAFVNDVTIPDNTQMTPGQSFTKTWLVQNSGSCDWETGFIFNIVGGESMSGVAVTLNQTVQPGRQYEFSVPMIAPTGQTGEIKGTWQLSDLNGNYFGQGVYVLIEIGTGTTTETPTPTLTPTP